MYADAVGAVRRHVGYRASKRARPKWLDWQINGLVAATAADCNPQAHVCTHELGEVDVNSINHTNDVEKGPETDPDAQDMYAELRYPGDRK